MKYFRFQLKQSSLITFVWGCMLISLFVKLLSLAFFLFLGTCDECVHACAQLCVCVCVCLLRTAHLVTLYACTRKSNLKYRSKKQNSPYFKKNMLFFTNGFIFLTTCFYPSLNCENETFLHMRQN